MVRFYVIQDVETKEYADNEGYFTDSIKEAFQFETETLAAMWLNENEDDLTGFFEIRTLFKAG